MLRSLHEHAIKIEFKRGRIASLSECQISEIALVIDLEVCMTA